MTTRRSRTEAAPSAMVTMNISLDEKLAEELENLAKESGRPAGELAADAVRALLARRQYLKAIDEGLEDAKAGRVVDGGEIDGILDEWSRPS
jgi:predicted transcriptional regulator